jgi:phage tail sheath protein FI
MYQLHQNSQIANPFRAIVDDYRALYNEFHQFAEFRRKDHMFVADPLRHIFVTGEQFQVLDDKKRTFTQHVYWPLKHLYSAANNSFSAVYGNWGKVLDNYSGKQIWVPMSGTLSALMANSDSNYAPWYAPAGFTRGRIAGINRLAVIPKQKNRDQLYRINVNPVTQFPNEGMVVFGQKTMFKMPSAFDRINVRRLFLYLERVVRKTMKFFLFEPNTFLTRSRVIDTLTPVFENVKNNEGMYDYLIICDERNNTPDVIDQNELVVDIYIKPVRAAEFILVNFYATRTGQDFSELVS